MSDSKTNVEWITSCRYRLVELVRHQWGDKSGDRLTWAIDEYLSIQPDTVTMRRQVREMAARLRELDPPVPVDRDNGVRWTGD
jgi:hypothetical protein